MVKAIKTGNQKKILNQTRGKGTSIGGGMIKTSSMNKSKKNNFKFYRGQGR